MAQEKARNIRDWSRTVKARDGHICQECGDSAKVIAHHIKRRDTNPEIELVVGNGVTLCRKCHGAAHANDRQREPAKVCIYINTEPELKEWLEAQAETDHRTLSDYVRLVLECHANRLQTDKNKAC